MTEDLCVESGCGRSRGVPLCGSDEDPVFFVDPCVRVYACMLKYGPLPKTKPSSQPPPHHRRTRRPASEGTPSCM